jgi:hypothetical protein
VLPLGEWNGSGRYVFAASADQQEEEASELRTAAGTYPTELKIERVPDGPADSRRVEILSKRGKIAELDGDRTHLTVVLEPVEHIADDRITVYRVTRQGLSLEAGPPDVSDGPAGPAHASCIVVDGDLVLQLHYLDGFVDTFRFRGDVLYKDGSYAPELEDGFIHWSERLRRQR